jgi:hypothetical protein
MRTLIESVRASLQALAKKCASLVLKVRPPPKPFENLPKPPKRGPANELPKNDRRVARRNDRRHDRAKPTKRAKNAKASRTKARDE